MALDEALLATVAGAPLLRLYAWAEPTVSCGYFESAEAARRVAGGRRIVRRWTGGGIVEHGDDLTYSLCVPRVCAFASLRGAESYRRVHAAVAAAVRSGGWSVETHAEPARLSPSHARGSECFQRPVPHDLLSDGQKIAGGAQRRTRAGLLHQGSVRIRFADPAALAAWKATMGSLLPLAFANHLEPREYTAAETTQAHELEAAKYATAAWTDRV